MLAMMTMRQDQQGQRQGAREQRRAEAHEPHEQGQPEDAVDDRRDAREIADVGLEQAIEPAVAGVLDEVDGGADADREGEDRRP